MNEYVVSMTEANDDTTSYFTFQCWADDLEHAEEQAFNAYPGAIILDIEQI